MNRNDLPNKEAPKGSVIRAPTVNKDTKGLVTSRYKY